VITPVIKAIGFKVPTTFIKVIFGIATGIVLSGQITITAV
jgi:hypothetical protein